MQIMRAVVGDKVHELLLPTPSTSLDQTTWGRFDELFTPAFWRGQVWQHQLMGTYADNHLGRDLREELAACLLGGHGIPASLGLAAFRRLRSLDLLSGQCDQSLLLTALEEPFVVAGKARRYRFARQKARYLAEALPASDAIDSQLDDRELRDALTHLSGVGLKTSSWVVRNLRGSNLIAILDVHIVRACRLARIFPSHLSPERHYRDLERRFLGFASAIGVPASTLDALMWDYMRRLPPGLARGLDSDHSNAYCLDAGRKINSLNGFAAEQPQWAEA